MVLPVKERIVIPSEVSVANKTKNLQAISEGIPSFARNDTVIRQDSIRFSANQSLKIKDKDKKEFFLWRWAKVIKEFFVNLLNKICGKDKQPERASKVENKTVVQQKEPEDPIWHKISDYRFTGDGTVVWEQNLPRYEHSTPDMPIHIPIINTHRVFDDFIISPGTMVVAFDPKGKLTVSVYRLTANKIDNRGRNIVIDSISPNQKLTAVQKDLIKAILGDTPEDMLYGEKDCRLADAFTLKFVERTVLGKERRIQCFSVDPKAFHDLLKKWASQADKLPKAKDETVQKFLSASGEDKNSPENRSALLKVLFDLDEKGKLTGDPGDVIAVVGQGVSGAVKRFKPRWVLANTEQTY